MTQPIQCMSMFVKLGGEVGQVDELLRHLSVGLGERHLVVRGVLVHKEGKGKANLYISFNGVPNKGTF
jgi:hypothetical protein